MKARFLLGWLVTLLAILVIDVRTHVTPAREYVSTRWIMAGRSTEGVTIAIGQELRIIGQSKNATIDRMNRKVRFVRGGLVLMRDGKNVEVKRKDVLNNGYIAAAAYDGDLNRFIVIRDPFMSTGASRCYRIDASGSVTDCRLPPGYVFKEGNDYLYANGNLLRHVNLYARPWAFWEWNFESGTERKLEEGLATMYMAVKTPEGGGPDETISYGVPSPDGSTNVRTLHAGVEIFRAGQRRTYEVKGGVQLVPELSPLASRACAGWTDSIAQTPIERWNLSWSHDSRKIYVCGLKQERGVVVDVNSGVVVWGPCLTGSTWSHDDSTVTGITDCGHETTTWTVEETKDAGM